MARRRRGLPVNGVLLLDKPKGLSSNHALQRARRLFQAQKAGHTGTLDPMATGLLPVCFGEATKFSAHLLTADKVYRTRVELGAVTETGDAEGEVVERLAVPVLAAADVEAVLESFRGEIEQVPPMYSALKHQGRRLYEIAREGGQVERPARSINIFELQLQAQTPTSLSLYVHCSKGTYIRSLVSDIGERLGCGAHVDTLRRVSLGPFQDAPMHSLHSLEALAQREGVAAVEALLLPTDRGLSGWPVVTVAQEVVARFCQGQAVATDSCEVGALVRVHDSAGELLGMGEVQQNLCVAPRRLLVQRPRQG